MFKKISNLFEYMYLIKKIVITLVLLLSLLISGCVPQNIEDIKSEENVGESVTVRGTVSNSVKIGDLSGYMITDDEDNSIAISSESIPEEGDAVTITGTLMRDTIFGYYIKN